MKLTDLGRPICFIIQPFDNGGRYDKRFGDVFQPAVEEAGLEPYRVDHDPEVRVPITRIEDGIKKSAVCLADISLDNPNVWFELGYAIATGKDVVLLCSDERMTPYPFDVQHRTIIKYRTESERDYRKLRSEIVKRLRALLARQARTEEPAEARVETGSILRRRNIPIPDGDLAAHEVAALKAVLEGVGEIDEEIDLYRLHGIMRDNGLARSAATLALKSLVERKMLSRDLYFDENDEECVTYELTRHGTEWVLDNSDQFPLWRDPNDEMPF